MAADIHQSTISMESGGPKRSSPSRKRRKILHTCTVSMLTTAERVSLKATRFDGPVGFLVNHTIQFITTKGPLVGLYRLQTHLILAIMSFLDDRILNVENVVEDHFPPTSYVFDKIDDIVCLTESFPTKLDEAVDNFVEVVNKYPLRDALRKIVDLVILLRNMLASWWGSDFAVTKERDIMVDTNCCENSQRTTRLVVCDESVCQIDPPTTIRLPEKLHKSDETQEPEKRTIENKHNDVNGEASVKIGDENGVAKDAEERVPKCSYKEVLEKGNSYKEVLETGHSFKEVVEKGSTYKDVLEKGTKEESKESTNEETKEESKESTNEETKEETKERTEEVTEDNHSIGDLKIVNIGNDPILELFESAWHMT